MAETTTGRDHVIANLTNFIDPITEQWFVEMVHPHLPADEQANYGPLAHAIMQWQARSVLFGIHLSLETFTVTANFMDGWKVKPDSE